MSVSIWASAAELRDLCDPSVIIIRNRAHCTANLEGGLRSSETAIEDIFMRRFLTGTFHGLVLSEVIIKRQHNHIRIAALIKQSLPARKLYFLIGYTEELLAYWLQCPVTLELQTVADPRSIIFKHI